MLLKLQKPIHGFNQMYYYNQDKSVEGFQTMDDSLERLFGKTFKLFIEGEIIKDKVVVLKKTNKEF